MKPLSEFAEGLRAEKAHTYSSENADHYRGFDAGMAHAADQLKERLAEADWELIHSQLSRADLIAWIREDILGTTRPEGEK